MHFAERLHTREQFFAPLPDEIDDWLETAFDPTIDEDDLSSSRALADALRRELEQ